MAVQSSDLWFTHWVVVLVDEHLDIVTVVFVWSIDNLALPSRPILGLNPFTNVEAIFHPTDGMDLWFKVKRLLAL
jgi:hypothetical protein